MAGVNTRKCCIYCLLRLFSCDYFSFFNSVENYMICNRYRSFLCLFVLFFFLVVLSCSSQYLSQILWYCINWLSSVDCNVFNRWLVAFWPGNETLNLESLLDLLLEIEDRRFGRRACAWLLSHFHLWILF